MNPLYILLIALIAVLVVLILVIAMRGGGDVDEEERARVPILATRDDVEELRSELAKRIDELSKLVNDVKSMLVRQAQESPVLIANYAPSSLREVSEVMGLEAIAVVDKSGNAVEVHGPIDVGDSLRYFRQMILDGVADAMVNRGGRYEYLLSMPNGLYAIVASGRVLSAAELNIARRLISNYLSAR